MIRNDNYGEFKMTIGSLLNVTYNGKSYSGEVVNVRTMAGERILFTLKIEKGYRSMYLDQCTACDYVGCTQPDLAGLAVAFAG
jgi:hypothetical protein